jgi:4-hydroxythreonine-4-phosphate dehydrogenase
MAITLGDPFSINVEMISQQLSPKNRRTYPIIIFGSLWHWRHQRNRLNHSSDGFDCLLEKDSKIHLTDMMVDKLYFYDVGGGSDPANEMSPEDLGKISVNSLEKIKELTETVEHEKWKLAVLTAPIDKYRCQLAGYKYPGQTEYFADLWSGDSIMILAGAKLKVGLVTNHLALSDVEKNLSADVIENKLLSFSQSLTRYYSIKDPKIAVCGLNPHCGDNGMFGTFDQDVTAPLLEKIDNINFVGPVPSDTAFWFTLKGNFDGVLAMYHDQGLGPLKTVHFDDAVNLTGGLRHLRLSPDHGPAENLFLTKKASNRSFNESFELIDAYLVSE